MANLLSDDDVFGSAPSGLLSDADVFGKGAKTEPGGFVASAKQAIGATAKGAGQAAADFIPGVGQENALKRYGQEIIEANPTAIHSFSDLADKPWTAVKEATGNALSSMGGVVGSRALGMGITAAAPFTGPAAPVVAGAGQAISWLGPVAAAALPSFGGIREQQIHDDPNAANSAAAKAAAAVGAGTVGAIESRFGPESWGSKMLTEAGRKEVAKLFAAKTLPQAVAKGAVRGAAVEGAEELAQNPVEQLAAFQNPLTAEALKDTAFSGAMGALGGGVLGGGTGAASRYLPKKPDVDPGNQPAEPPKALPAPTYTGTPGDQTLQATVDRQNAVDAAQAAADTLYNERDAFERERAANMGTATHSPNAPIRYEPGLISGVDVGGPTEPPSPPGGGIDFTPPQLPDTGPLSRAANLALGASVPMERQAFFPFQSFAAAERMRNGRDDLVTRQHPSIPGRFTLVPAGLETPVARQAKPDVQQGTGSFSDQNELANFIADERKDQSARKAALAEGKNNAIAQADQAVADARQFATRNERLSILDGVLSSLAPGQNPNRRFDAALKAAGFRDTSFTEEERAVIGRYGNVASAFAVAPEASVEPSSPGEIEAAIPAAKGKGDSGIAGVRADRVRSAIAAGFTQRKGFSLINPATGEKFALKTPGMIRAAKEALEQSNPTTEIKSEAVGLDHESGSQQRPDQDGSRGNMPTVRSIDGGDRPASGAPAPGSEPAVSVGDGVQPDTALIDGAQEELEQRWLKNVDPRESDALHRGDVQVSTASDAKTDEVAPPKQANSDKERPAASPITEQREAAGLPAATDGGSRPVPAVSALEETYRPLIERLIRNKRVAKELGFDIDGAIVKAKAAMAGTKQMPGSFRALAKRAEKKGDTETAAILNQIADLNDARKSPKKADPVADQNPIKSEAPAVTESVAEKAQGDQQAAEKKQAATNPDEKEGADLSWAEVLDEAWNNGFETGNADFVPQKQHLEQAYQRTFTDAQVEEYTATYQRGARESDEKASPPEGSKEGVAESGFDSESWDKEREARIKASKQSGAIHLDDVPASVESMRGKEIFYVHNPKQRGVIRTVDNRGNVYVYWSDKYSADKEMASEVVEGNKTWLRSSKNLPYIRTERSGKTYVFQSSLGTSDLKDYVFADAKENIDTAANEAATSPTNDTPQPSESKPDTASKWSEGTNGFTGHKSYTFQPESGAYWATVQTSEQPNSYTISYRKGDQIIETEELGGAIGGMKFHVASRVRDFAAAEKAQHIENGKTETATPSVIAASVQKSAAKTEFNPKEALSWLLGKVDEAIAEAPTAKEKGVWDNVNQAVKLDGMMNLEEAIGFKVFDVPGDGRFKVLNLKERLQAFRDNVEKSPGFRKPITPRSQVTPAWQQTRRSGTESTIRELLEDGDLTAAYEFAKQIGKPMVFGDGRDGPIVYTDARQFELDGFDDFPMVSARTFTGNSDTWAVIHPDSGLAIVSGEKTRAKAESETRKKVSALRPDSRDVMKQKMGAAKGAQNTLAERWLAGAEEAEKKAQASDEQENRTARLTHSGLFNNPNWKRGEEAAKPAPQPNGTEQSKPAEEWHTALPTEGLPVTKEQGKSGGYSRVPNVLAADAWDAITQAQRINGMPMYAYYLPAEGGRNGIVRLVPDDQNPPAPWKLLNGEAIRNGMMTKEQGVAKLANWLSSAPILAKEEAPKAKTEAKDSTPSAGKYTGPADVSSRDGQVELANRAGTIASLKAMNEQLQSVAPAEALSDSEIENAKNLDALRDRISTALVKANRDKSSARHFRGIDSLNALTAPVEEGDWFRIDGKGWQARNGYTGRGWSLIDADKKTHPTINNIEANSDLIREIVAADGAVEAAAEKELRTFSEGSTDGMKSPLAVTYILRDKSDSFFEKLRGFDSPQAKFDYLQKAKGDLQIPMEIGGGKRFGDQVDLNRALRDGKQFAHFSLAPRRGYVLATLTIDLAGAAPAETDSSGLKIGDAARHAKETEKGIALFRNEDGQAIPESEWLSVGAITDQLEQLREPFGTAIPVTVIDRVTDIGIESYPDDGVTSGVTFKGKIHLVREGLVDSAAVARTFWHELLHFGLRRFMTRAQYIEHLGRLYASDGWVRHKADQWIAGPEGRALHERGDSEGYIRARGVDEALAALAETLQSNPTGYRNNGFLARAIRSVRSWVADVAEFFGFHDAAQAWRSFAAQDQARDLVVSTFARLREGAPPSMMTTNWHYSDPAFMVAWHGSPHDHDGFSADRIGSGEGAQAYGWGLYFASERAVAEHYRHAGRYGDTFEYGKTIKDIRANLKERHGTGNFRVTRDGEIHARDDDGMWKFKGWVPPAGKLYKVELAPSEDEYLDWDKPLSEQSEFVQKSIRPLVKSFANDLGEKFSSIWNDYAGTFYQYLARSYTAKAASGDLYDVGIRGIRYLDGSSRSHSEGSHNYVIFDDADVTITGKESRAPSFDSSDAPQTTLIRRVVDSFLAHFQGAAALDIRVVASRNEIPPRYRPSPYAEGVYHDADGVVYLISSNLPTQARAWQVLMHEAIGHYGLSNLMGEKFAALQSTVLQKATTGRELSRHPQPGEADYATVEAVRRLYPEASDSEVAQEVLARMAEMMDPPGWSKILFAQVRHWLRTAARAMNLTVEPSLQEAKDAVVLAAKHLRDGKNLEREMAGEGQAFASEGAPRLAPNGKPSRLNAHQWKQVRTPEFKAWFGDWEASAILNGEPLTSMKTADAPSGGFKAVEDWAASLFAEQGGVAVREGLGEVLLDRRAAKTSMAHGGANQYKKVAFAAVKDVIERGALVHRTANGDVDSFYFSAPVDIDGVNNIETVLVHRDANTGRMYLHSVMAKESLLNHQVSRADAGASERSGSTDSEGISRILQDLVRRNGVSKVVDENGEPRVVYHGTNRDFNIFKTKAGPRSQMVGDWDGVHFTNDLDQAQSIADSLARREGGEPKVVEAYLLAENPTAFGQYRTKAQAEAKNHDSRLTENNTGLQEWTVFSPTQIKSATGNNGNFSPANPDIRESRSSGPATWQAPDPSRLDDLIYSMQDKHVDMKRVVQSIKQTAGTIADNIDPYLQEELFHGRAAKAVKDFLDLELRPLIAEMRMRGVGMADFEEYLWNRHAEERNAQIAKINPQMPDGGSGLATADARAYLAGLSSDKRKAYESLAAKIDAITARNRQVLVDSGLEKAETVAAWEGAYKHYVPLQREDVETGGNGTGQGFSVRGTSSKRAVGSGRPVADIIANLAMQRERFIVKAEKNRVSIAIAGLAVSNPNPDFWKIDDAPKERVVETIGGQDQVVERTVPSFRTQENVVHFRLNGEDHFVIFNEREPRAMRMAQSIKNLDMDQLGRVLTVAGKVTRYFAAINTQYNPIFGIINLFRDVQGALLNLSTTPLAGEQKRVAGYTVDALRGIYADIRAHRAGKVPSSRWAKLYEEFQNEGGQTGYRDQFSNAEQRAEAIAKEIRSMDRNVAFKAAGAVFDWLSDYNQAMENAVRLAAYAAAKDRGLSKQQAASLAKNLTVNFNRKGQVATQMGALYAFFNASMQGTARLAQTLTGPMGRRIITGGILLGSMQALLLASAGMGDDEPPEFVRERNLILPIGDGKYISLPMPLGFHVLPNLGRIPVEFVMSGFREPARRISDLVAIFADTFNPIGNAGLSLQTIAPTVVDPFAALAENKDWTGKPIAKMDMNANSPTPGHNRAKDTSTVWSKSIAEAINYLSGGTKYKPGVVSPTPDQIDYLIGQVTGGVGREAAKAEQTVTSTIFTGEELPLHKVPLVGRFVGDTKGQSAEGSKFYAALQRINEHENEIKGMRKDGRGAEIAGYIQDNPEARLMLYSNHVEREVQKLRAAKRDALERGDEGRVRMIESALTAKMRAFNERVRSAQGSAN